MPLVQRLYDLCKVSFSNDGPVSSEALEKVRSLLDRAKPSDVGLGQEAELVKGWKAPSCSANGKKGCNGILQYTPPIKYLHLHECDSFSMGIFCMPPSSTIPLHNHPEMTVLSKLLFGSLRVRSFDWVDNDKEIDYPAARPAKLVKDGEMSAPCGATILYPRGGGNIHSFEALTPCALFDILSPPYSTKDGRRCSYFRKFSRMDFTANAQLGETSTCTEVAWLEEFQPPDSFVIRRGEYLGPAIRTR